MPRERDPSSGNKEQVIFSLSNSTGYSVYSPDERLNPRRLNRFGRFWQCVAAGSSNSKCSKFLGFPNRRKNDSALEWSFCRLFFLV